MHWFYSSWTVENDFVFLASSRSAVTIHPPQATLSIQRPPPSRDTPTRITLPSHPAIAAQKALPHSVAQVEIILPQNILEIYIFLKMPSIRKVVPLFSLCRRSPFSALWHLLLPQQWLQFKPPILHHHPLQQVINLLYTPVIQKHLCTYVYRCIIVLSIW